MNVRDTTLSQWRRVALRSEVRVRAAEEGGSNGQMERIHGGHLTYFYSWMLKNSWALVQHTSTGSAAVGVLMLDFCGECCQSLGRDEETEQKL